MAKAKKLPSGAWRCQVYSHIEEILKDGTVQRKRIYESFTADTKREAEFLAAQFAQNKDDHTKQKDITLWAAVTLYIQSKEHVLSPSTINGYMSLQKNYFSDIGVKKIKKLTREELQVWVNTLSASHSPKTVRNANALMSACLDMFRPGFRANTRLPQKTKPKLYTPGDSDIRKLLSHIEGKELEIAVLLAAFGPLRRGEICALTDQDIKGNVITVSKSMVLNNQKQWVIKQPKTYSSYRQVVFPEFVMKKISGIDGRIIKATPNQITARFQRAVTSSDVPHFRFHDLRHYSASIQHALGIPDQYIMQRGGWASDNVMKAVYRNAIDDQTAKFNRLAFEHFENIQHEMQP